MSERKGKPIVKRRATKVNREQTPSFNYTIDQAFEHFISIKKSLGVRERTMRDYFNLMGYFKSWIEENYPHIETVQQVDKCV